MFFVRRGDSFNRFSRTRTQPLPQFNEFSYSYVFSVDTQVVAVAPHNSVEPKREGLQWFVRDATSGSVTVTLESTKQSVYIVGCSNTHVVV